MEHSKNFISALTIGHISINDKDISNILTMRLNYLQEIKISMNLMHLATSYSFLHLQLWKLALRNRTWNVLLPFFNFLLSVCLNIYGLLHPIIICIVNSTGFEKHNKKHLTYISLLLVVVLFDAFTKIRDFLLAFLRFPSQKETKPQIDGV